MSNWFWSLEDVYKIESQSELYEHLKISDHLKDTIYLPGELTRENSKQTTRIKNKKFERVSFSKTSISGIIFRDCTFHECQFINATITNCEFHNCRFVSTNMHKSSILQTYIDPLSFSECLDEQKHQNIGVHLYQTLLKNSRDEDQIQFERDARFLFLRWKRFQDAYQISRIWKNRQVKDRKTEFTYRVISYLLQLLWEKLCGSGVRIRYFIRTVIFVIAIFSSINFCFRVEFGIVSGDIPITNFIESIYFTTISLTTLGYGDLVPTTNSGRLFAAFQSVVGFVLFAILASMLFRRVSP